MTNIGFMGGGAIPGKSGVPAGQFGRMEGGAVKMEAPKGILVPEDTAVKHEPAGPTSQEELDLANKLLEKTDANNQNKEADELQTNNEATAGAKVQGNQSPDKDGESQLADSTTDDSSQTVNQSEANNESSNESTGEAAETVNQPLAPNANDLTEKYQSMHFQTLKKAALDAGYSGETQSREDFVKFLTTLNTN